MAGIAENGLPLSNALRLNPLFILFIYIFFLKKKKKNALLTLYDRLVSDS
jgi:hypothetical protein